MKIEKTLNGWALLLCLLCLVGCGDYDDEFIPFPEGTSSLRMMNEENGKTLLGNSDMYITNEWNFRSGQFPIFDRGARRGISDIDMPDFVNMAPEVAVVPGHGYILCTAGDVYEFPSRKYAIRENASVYRVYVDSWIQDKEGNQTGANVYFLLGRPDESGRIPVWGSNVGTLSWDYAMGVSGVLSVPLPFVDADDVEVVFVDEQGSGIDYRVNEGRVDFTEKEVMYDFDCRVRIRCGNIYTEVFFSVRN